MPVHQVIYRSIATIEISPLVLTDLLDASRANNRRLGLTGMLVCLDGRFAQVLEGDAGRVNGLMRRIAADYRHHSIELLVDRDVPAPEFGNWSMAYSGTDWRCTGDPVMGALRPNLPHIRWIEELAGEQDTAGQLVRFAQGSARRFA